MKHEYYEILASRDKDNDLSTEEKAILTKHLFNCKKCQKLKTEFNSLSSFLGGDTLGEGNNKSVIYNFRKHILSAAAILIVAGVSFVTFMGDDKSKINYIEVTTTTTTTIENPSKLEDTTLSSSDNEGVLSAYFDYTYIDENESESDDEYDYDIVSSYFSYTSSYEN